MVIRMYYGYVVLWSNDGSLHYLCHYMDCTDWTILQRPHSSTGEHTHTNSSKVKFACLHDSRSYLHNPIYVFDDITQHVFQPEVQKFDPRKTRHKNIA